MFVPLQLASDARELHFVAKLDETIDLVAKRAAWESLGQDRDKFEKYLEENPDEDGIVVGDEMRLRQIITNLARYTSSF